MYQRLLLIRTIIAISHVAISVQAVVVRVPSVLIYLRGRMEAASVPQLPLVGILGCLIREELEDSRKVRIYAGNRALSKLPAV